MIRKELLGLLETGASTEQIFLQLQAVCRAQSFAPNQFPQPSLSLKLRATSAGHIAVHPPSTRRVCPVIISAAALARNTTAPVTSSGLPNLPSGMRRNTSRENFLSSKSF